MKMKSQNTEILAALAALMGAGTTAQAQYTYSTLDFPPALGTTYARGIQGTDVVGNYLDASGLGHGFLYNGSAWITLDDPLAPPGYGYPFGTFAQATSGTNTVGYYYDANKVGHGFSYNGSVWTTLDVPAAGTDFEQGTYACSISGGNIVGSYLDRGNNLHGFLYNGTTWITLDDPLAGSGRFQGTIAQGIAGSNIVGCYADTNNKIHGFLYDGSTWTTLDDPQALELVPEGDPTGDPFAVSPFGSPTYGTTARGISGSNIVGYYYDTNGVGHGFLYHDGNWTTLDDPLGAGGTFAQGISGSSIVGFYYGANGNNHGFLYDGSNYSTLDDPLGVSQVWIPEGTQAKGISGTNIVGLFSPESGAVCVGCPPPAVDGFLYNGSAWTTLDAPLADTTGASGISGSNIVGGYGTSWAGYETVSGYLYNGSTWLTLEDPLAFTPSGYSFPPPAVNGTAAQGISGSNIVGYYYDTNYVGRGFLYNDGNWTALNDPLGVGGTFAQGISGTNIVGYYYDTSNNARGFLYNGSTWTTLDDPLGVQGTYVRGISGSNIVGYFIDRGTHTHGFLYNGDTWTTLDEPLASPVLGTHPQGICGANIVGYYYDTGENVHGFLATPIPQLAITLSGNRLKMSWPYYPSVSWTLQQKADLNTTNWAPSGGTISNDGTNDFITITAPAGNSFFRLSQ